MTASELSGEVELPSVEAELPSGEAEREAELRRKAERYDDAELSREAQLLREANRYDDGGILRGPEPSGEAEPAQDGSRAGGARTRQEANTLPDHVRELYIDRAKEDDADRVKRWTGDMESLLLFSALFSAIVTAFLVTTYPDLQPDDSLLGQQLLQQILCNMQGKLEADCPVLVASFPPTSSTIQLNIYWFTSLILSLSASFLAILVKQWIGQFEAGYVPDPVMRSRQHAFRILSLRKWRMHSIITFIPVLLHIALIFFFVGLLELLRSLQRTLATIATVLIAITLFFYVATTLLPIVRVDCPFKTPLMSLIRDAIINMGLVVLAIIAASSTTLHGLYLSIAWAFRIDTSEALPDDNLQHDAAPTSIPVLLVLVLWKGPVHLIARLSQTQIMSKAYVHLHSLSYRFSGTTRENEAVQHAWDYLDATIVAELVARKEEKGNMTSLVGALHGLQAHYHDLAKHPLFFTDSDGILPLSGLSIIVSLSQHFASLTDGNSVPYYSDMSEQVVQCMNVLTMLTTETGNVPSHKQLKTILGFFPKYRVLSRSGAILYPVDSVGVNDYMPILGSAIEGWHEKVWTSLLREDQEERLDFVANILRIRAKVLSHRRPRDELEIPPVVDALFKRIQYVNEVDEHTLMTVTNTLAYIILRSEKIMGPNNEDRNATIPRVIAVFIRISKRSPMLSDHARLQILWTIYALLDPPKNQTTSVVIPQLSSSHSFIPCIGQHIAKAILPDQSNAGIEAEWCAQVELLLIGGILRQPMYDKKGNEDRCRIVKVFLPKYVAYLTARESTIHEYVTQSSMNEELSGWLAEIIHITSYIAYNATDEELSNVDLVKLIPLSLKILKEVSLRIDTIPSHVSLPPQQLLHVACRLSQKLSVDRASKGEMPSGFIDDMTGFLHDAVQALVTPVKQPGWQMIKQATQRIKRLCRVAFPEPLASDMPFNTSASTEAVALTFEIMYNLLDRNRPPPSPSRPASRTALSARQGDERGVHRHQAEPRRTPTSSKSNIKLLYLLATENPENNRSYAGPPMEMPPDLLLRYVQFLEHISKCKVSTIVKPLEIAGHMLLNSPLLPDVLAGEAGHSETIHGQAVRRLSQSFISILEDIMERSSSCDQSIIQLYTLTCKLSWIHLDPLPDYSLNDTASSLHNSPPKLEPVRKKDPNETILVELLRILVGIANQDTHPQPVTDPSSQYIRPESEVQTPVANFVHAALTAVLTHFFTKSGLGISTEHGSRMQQLRKDIRHQVERLRESASHREWSLNIKLVGEELGSEDAV